MRIRDAVLQRTDWVYLVLTFGQSEWEDKREQYKLGCSLWSALRKRFVRRWGKIEYVQTWERHKKGGAHVNVIIANQPFADACSGDGWKKVRKEWLVPAITDVGFGKVVWLEPVRSLEEMAGYLTKLAEELTGGGKSQIPWDAPYHFRRLRASQGTLPPIRKGEDWTGRMRWVSADVARLMHAGTPPET